MLRFTGWSIYVTSIGLHGFSRIARGFRSQASRASRKRNLVLKVLAAHVNRLPPEVQNVVPSARTGASEIVLAGVIMRLRYTPRGPGPWL